MPDIDLDDYSGVFVGGSPFNASDPPATKSDVQLRVEAEMSGLLDRVVAADFPFFGACYGVGTLGVHRGGTIDREYGEAVDAVHVRLTEAGERDPLFSGIPPAFLAWVGHKEAVTRLPPDATLLATGDACPVQAFRVKTNLYATQFHPELTADDIVERRQKAFLRPGIGFIRQDLDEVGRGAGVELVVELLGSAVQRLGFDLHIGAWMGLGKKRCRLLEVGGVFRIGIAR